jgi:hypothetical protein
MVSKAFAERGKFFTARGKEVEKDFASGANVYLFDFLFNIFRIVMTSLRRKYFHFFRGWLLMKKLFRANGNEEDCAKNYELSKLIVMCALIAFSGMFRANIEEKFCMYIRRGLRVNPFER